MKKFAIIYLLVLYSCAAQSQTGWTSQRTKVNFRDSLKFYKDANFLVSPRFQNGFTIGNTPVTVNGLELNILDGALVNTTELNRLVGVTSSVQSQLDAKAPIASPVFTGSFAKIGTDTLATRSYARAVSGYGGGGGSATWGLITGTLGDQTDLMSALNAKAPLNSPTFTGTPTVPGYVPTSTTVNGKALSSNITLNLSDVGFSYPGSGIVVSSGSGWSTSITDNSSNWNTAYSERRQWDGGSTNLNASTGRTSLGATTVGSNLFTLANPGAIRFIRINADNTVSTLTNTDFKTALSLTASDVGLGNVTNESKATMFTNPTFTGLAKLNTDTLATKSEARGYVNELATEVRDTVELEDVALLKHTSINAQTGTTYTLALTDDGKVVTCNNSSAITVTVPPNSSVAFPIGTQVSIIAIGAGQVTIAAGSGVTINSAGGALKLRVQYSTGTLLKIGTNTWILFGDITAS